MTSRTHRGWTAAVSVAGLRSPAATAGAERPTATTTVPAGAITLVAFDSCDDLLNGLRAAAKSTVTEYGLPGAERHGTAMPATGRRGSPTAPGPPSPAGNDAAGPGAVPAARLRTPAPAYSDTNIAERASTSPTS